MLIYGINVSEIHPTEETFVRFLHKYELVKDKMACEEIINE